LGKRGPPPTDPKILKLRGTFRPHLHAHLAPPVRAPGQLDALPVPDWFNSELSTIWQRLLAALPRRLLGEIDRDLLACLVEAIDRHARASKALREAEAAPITDAIAEVIANLTKRVRQAGSDMRNTAQALGITPAARARISLPSSDPSDDPFRRFVQVA
jgi:P27 family predicted phage terminase small subunit